jgi:hypothetical protein
MTADDAAHAGGRALIGLDGRRVVVAFDADGNRDSIARVDHPRALPRPDEDVGSFRRQPAQVDGGGLVGAVLAPHDAEHRQLQMIGRPAHDALDVDGLIVGQPEGPVDPFVAHAITVSAIWRRALPRKECVRDTGIHGCA